MADKYVKESNLIVVRNWIKEKLQLKQNKLTAGDNITITGDVISASGGGGGDVTKAYVDEQDNKLKQDYAQQIELLKAVRDALKGGDIDGAVGLLDTYLLDKEVLS